MKGRNGLLYPLIGFVSCLIVLFITMGDFRSSYKEPEISFVEVSGHRFMVDGKTFYVNGWNSYWLMDQAVEDFSRHRVRKMFQIGSKMGLSVCRTWAFNDGGYNALQVSPGRFDERVFKGLDHVIAEARRNGVRLILSLVNNLQPFGGKTQYVKWAWAEGVGLSSSNDSFFYDPTIRNYFKTYIKVVLTRKNSINGIEYRNDPTILGWELINEPRCMTDPSGDTLQEWIEEMSSFVKSIDKNHLVTIGLEGFYGSTTPERLTVNPHEWASKLGSDFIRNSRIPNIDFASAHIYPDHWFIEQDLQEQMKFITKWVVSHIEDGQKLLHKPVLFTEFGMSNLDKNFSHENREKLYKLIFNLIQKSARKQQSGAGAFIWQLMVEGMDEYGDDFFIVPTESTSMSRLITKHSCKLAVVQKDENILKRIPQDMC